ncbi:MAG: hypothetical protein NVS1B11_04080 [Terriglobales bacterium]
MTCVEFERVLPDIIEGEHTAEQQAHLTMCSSCSGLMSDLNVISEQARLLQASEEPNPRVWNALELALRREGLIRDPKHEQRVSFKLRRPWHLGWLVPTMAAFLLTVVFLQYQRSSNPPPQQGNTVSVASDDHFPANDQELLHEVSMRAPAMRESYGADLDDVNAYIRDAESAAKNNPNDEGAQRYLMNAYEQKAMVYEMALDRSLP